MLLTSYMEHWLRIFSEYINRVLRTFKQRNLIESNAKMADVLKWLVLLTLFVTSSLGHRSSIVFDQTSTDAYVDAICGATNTTCREAAEKCYWQVKKARTFLADLSSSSVTLHDRCNQMRDRFDTCAEEANLNATWSTITGSDRSCEGSFLRGGPFRRGYRRGRRTVPYNFHSAFYSGYPSFSGPRQYYDNNRVDAFNFQRNWGSRGRQRRSRIFGGSSRRGGRRRDRGEHSFDDSQSTSRVGTFIARIEETNPDALQNYTRCMLRQEGLLYSNDTVARDQFQTWATVAFATQSEVADAVKTALDDCPEPDDAQLSDYMQCWGEACVEAS